MPKLVGHRKHLTQDSMMDLLFSIDNMQRQNRRKETVYFDALRKAVIDKTATISSVADEFGISSSHLGLKLRKLLVNGRTRNHNMNNVTSKILNGYTIKLKNGTNKSVQMDTLLDLKQFTQCEVKCLEGVNELARKYRGTLNLKLITTKRINCLNANGKEHTLKYKLQQWEHQMNSVSHTDPYISVENVVDDEGPPKDFHYVRENLTNHETDYLLDPQFLVGCDCAPRCSVKNCCCPRRSGGEFGYDRTKRILLPPGSPIYECNKQCKCLSDECPNRVIQKGMTAKVCIFRTPDGRGWGLKTMEFIPKNKFVIEYVGEIITSEEAERRGKFYDARQQTYLFDLDFHDKDCSFTVDAYKYGNCSHFINHSCDPNLQVYSVWVDTLDPRLPRIGLFAVRDIKAGEELSFDYLNNSDGQSFGGMSPSKHGSNSTRHFCACKAEKCRKFLF